VTAPVAAARAMRDTPAVARAPLSLGIAVAAAALLLLVALPDGGGAGEATAGLVPQGITPAIRFAAALQALGTTPRRTWSRGDTVWALVRDVTPTRMPRLRVDAALAASAISHTCHCPVAAYGVTTDRFGPDEMTVLSAPTAPAGDDRGRLDDRVVRMDGASDSAVSRRAERVATAAAAERARRVTRVIVRDGQVVFAYARRPATGQSWDWALPGITEPPLDASPAS
jgi:hypothetical protein